MKLKRIVMYAIAVVVVLVCNQPGIADPSMRLLIALVGFALLFLIGFLESRRQKRENDDKPIVSVKAEVTGRRTQVEKRGKFHVRVHYLTFTTGDGSVLEFEVSELEFGRFAMNERGTLQYRGWQYLGLRRYDLSGMEPLVQPEAARGDSTPAENTTAPRQTGILTHELEE